MKSLAVFLAILASAVSTAPASGVQPSTGILPTVDCPNDNPFPTVVYVPIPTVGGQELGADQYVVCFKGEPLIFNCSEGLFFNWSTMSCDFPYERRSSSRSNPKNETTSNGDFNIDNAIPAGPIPVPTSPQLPIPLHWRSINGGPGHYPFPPYPFPITKPDPSVIMPIPVLPAHPPSPYPIPVPYYYY